MYSCCNYSIQNNDVFSYHFSIVFDISLLRSRFVIRLLSLVIKQSKNGKLQFFVHYYRGLLRKERREGKRKIRSYNFYLSTHFFFHYYN